MHHTTPWWLILILLSLAGIIVLALRLSCKIHLQAARERAAAATVQQEDITFWLQTGALLGLLIAIGFSCLYFVV